MISFYQRSNYGAPPRAYIFDEQVAADLERLTGRKTYSLTDLHILAKLGVKFVEITDPRNWDSLHLACVEAPFQTETNR